MKKAKLGSGKRFSTLKTKLAKKGATNPEALAAYIGRKRYGVKKMAKMAVAGRKNVNNIMKKNDIRARLTIYGHEEMSDKEFKFFKKWLTKVVPETVNYKRGELSKVFRQTLYKD